MGLLTIFLTSFFGSVHCAGMCGGFVALCTVESKRVPASVCGYHLGRLNTYLLIGVAAGLIGASIKSAGIVIGIHYLASALLGGMLIVSGVAALSGRRLLRPDHPLLRRLSSGVLTIVRHGNQLPIAFLRSFIIGTVTTLLPCGWLYSFAVVAATTGTPIDAVAVMFVFWLGTIPCLVATGALARALGGSLGQLAPRLTAVAVILAGVISLAQHELSFFGDVASSGTCHQP